VKLWTKRNGRFPRLFEWLGVSRTLSLKNSWLRTFCSDHRAVRSDHAALVWLVWPSVGRRVVDASLAAAPSSTEDGAGQPAPQMHQAKKGEQWHLGMEAHIEVDADAGSVHAVFSKRSFSNP